MIHKGAQMLPLEGIHFTYLFSSRAGISCG